jgi:hypothetical protein
MTNHFNQPPIPPNGGLFMEKLIKSPTWGLPAGRQGFRGLKVESKVLVNNWIVPI